MLNKFYIKLSKFLIVFKNKLFYFFQDKIVYLIKTFDNSIRIYLYAFWKRKQF